MKTKEQHESDKDAFKLAVKSVDPSLLIRIAEWVDAGLESKQILARLIAARLGR